MDQLTFGLHRATDPATSRVAAMSIDAPTLADGVDLSLIAGLEAGIEAFVAGNTEDASYARIVAAIDRQTNLLSLPLDSAALLELMTRLEDTYRVFIPHEKAFEFETVGAIGDYISERLTAKAARG